MISIHLLVEEDYIETLMQILPREKVKVVEENFQQNISLLEATFQQYHQKSEEFESFSIVMQRMNHLFEEKGKQ